VKKVLLIGTVVLLTATSASAQSGVPRRIIQGNQDCFYMYNGPGVSCRTRSSRELAAEARARANHQCRAFGNCGQQRQR
jgi:hypothetical protein